MTGSERVEGILNQFAEVMSKLMLDHYHQQVTALDLTLLQAQVLRALRPGPMPIGQLAAALGISAPAITQMTDRLIRKRLIERRALPGDRRAVVITLSAKGRRLVDQFRQRRSEIFSRALTQLSEADQAQVIKALGKVIEALEEYESEQEGKRSRAVKATVNQSHKQAQTGKIKGVEKL